MAPSADLCGPGTPAEPAPTITDDETRASILNGQIKVQSEAAMRDGAILINTARGLLIDEAALIDCRRIIRCAVCPTWF